ncbi:SHOCT domain-containing protein [Mycolicibacterium vaccae]|uniref:SHOCT domain-containing protein n=1 Tax=Mycolicibacterium vaccae TaxID=1810 RepID=UPI003D0933BA
MWDSFWDYFWSLLVIFAFIAYLIILFQILVDLFWRDHKTSGWVKALWVLFLILFPYLTALIYLIARGGGMADRAREQALQAQRDTDEYIRHAAGRSPAQEIADAKALLDTGAISPDEFESLKARALREGV